MLYALRVLEGQPKLAEHDEEWLSEKENRLRAEVESFAEEFFTLPSPQRRERWETLFSRCSDLSPLAARLQALKAGLEVEIQNPPQNPSLYGRLAGQLLQSFPLQPMAQAVSRQAFLRQIEESSTVQDQRSWERSARFLQAEWPVLAALDQELVQDIAKLRSRLKRRSKMHQRSQRQRQATSAGSRKGSPWWLLVFLPGLLTAVMRGLPTSNNSTSPRMPSFNYNAPNDGKGLQGYEGFRGQIVTDPETGAKSVQFSPYNVPPIQELFDPSKFDVEIVNPIGVRILRFTPRPNTIITGPNGPQANNGQPLLYGEAALRLIGVSKEQVDLLFLRTAMKKHSEEMGPRPLKSSQGDKTRP